MSQPTIFDSETPLPSDVLAQRQKTLLGFDDRYARVHDQLRLLLNVGQLTAWNKEHHGGKLALCDLVAEQYPSAPLLEVGANLERPLRRLAAARPFAE